MEQIVFSCVYCKQIRRKAMTAVLAVGIFIVAMGVSLASIVFSCLRYGRAALDLNGQVSATSPVYEMRFAVRPSLLRPCSAKIYQLGVRRNLMRAFAAPVLRDAA
jgi:hypothetical protein